MDSTAGSDIESGIGSSSATGVSGGDEGEGRNAGDPIYGLESLNILATGYTRLYRGGMINLLVCSYKKSVAFEYYIATIQTN